MPRTNDELREAAHPRPLDPERTGTRSARGRGPRHAATKLIKDGPAIELKRVGRSDASTFTGLCAEHDAELFRPLDTRDLDLNDPEQMFLLAYRSVTRELHAVMEGAMRRQMTYKSLVDRGIVSGEEPSDPGIRATQQILIAHQTWVWRLDNLDKNLLDGNFGAIVHDVVELRDARPTLAVSSLFSLEELARDGNPPMIVLNVVPLSEERSVAVFSYTPDDRPRAAPVVEPIRNAAGDYQKFELSRLIIRSIENFVLRPSIVDSWPAAKAEAIKAAFIRTVLSGHKVPNTPEMMLFE